MCVGTCHCERSTAIQLRGIFAVGLFLLTLGSTATAKYSGGSGTAQDPYQIATATELITLGETPTDYDKHFILTADIDLDPNLPGRKVFDKAIIAPDTDPRLNEFGYQAYDGRSFSGVFDGDGHTISHLTIKGGSYLALFGQLASGAEVKNLGVAGVNITGSGWFVSGLVGRSQAAVTQCYSTGMVSGSGDGYVGGLVGSNDGMVTQCYNAAAVSGTRQYGPVGGLVGSNAGTVTQSYSTGVVSDSGDGYVGGLVGCNYRAVTQCYSTGAISGSGRVGGLVGWNRATVTQCYGTGRVSGNSSVGGLAGDNSGSLTDCYSIGAANGNWQVGGLVGSNNGLYSQNGAVIQRCHSTAVVNGGSGVGGLVGGNCWGSSVTQCYSSGPVRGTGWSVGGLAGFNHGTVTQCFSIGAASGSERVGGAVGSNWGNVTHCYSTGGVTGDSDVGGLVGDNGGGWEEPTGTVSNCLWDMQTSGRTESAGGTGKTTAQMQTANTFLDANWDFVGEMANGSDDIWGILEGKDYPRLAWELWAFSPVPAHGATDVIQSPMLSWLTARRAVAHDVYFGEDKTAVANATPASLGIYRGRHPVEAVTFDPGPLEWGRTYYWRIDEVNPNEPDSVWKGSVWSFSTSDIPVVAVLDDFESYNDNQDAGEAIFQTWLDRGGWNKPEPNYPGNGTGSTVGNQNLPFTEQTIVHGGKQSMPMDYNNVKPPHFSETQRTWATPQDWTIEGADTLTLYFRGKADNGREPLYVAIEDSAGRMAVVVHPDAEAVQTTEWQKWHISLNDMRAAGVNVAAVKKMCIGVCDRKNPQPGGTGRIYIDDIRLTKRMP